jgi:hypothetical protein
MRVRRSRAVAPHRRGPALQAAGQRTILMAVEAHRVRVEVHPAAVAHRIQAEALPEEAAGGDRIAAAAEEAVAPMGAAAVVEAAAISD